MRKQILLFCSIFFLVSCTLIPPGGQTTTPMDEATPIVPIQPANPETPLTPKPGSISTPQPGEPFKPLDPGDANVNRASVFIDSAQLLFLESYPPQVNLILSGSLPTPCHQLRVAISDPDELNRINVEVYSVADADVICVQVLEPFEETISLGSFASGTYQVFINGEEIGAFDS